MSDRSGTKGEYADLISMSDLLDKLSALLMLRKNEQSIGFPNDSLNSIFLGLTVRNERLGTAWLSYLKKGKFGA